MPNNDYACATSVMELATMAARRDTIGQQRNATISNAYMLLKGVTDAMELIALLTPSGYVWTEEQKALYWSFSLAATELANGLTSIIDLADDRGANRGN